MNKIDGELISALLDGEVAPDRRHQNVSDVIDAGPEALATYGRYRLIGDLLRDESARPVDVARQVSEALRDEPVVLAPPAREPRSWIKPAAGFALAASVAVTAVLVAPQLLTGGDVSPGNQSLAELPQPAMAPRLVSDVPPRAATTRAASLGDRRWHALDAKLEDRLNRLVIEHHEYTGRSGINGPVPHVGLVSYDGR